MLMNISILSRGRETTRTKGDCKMNIYIEVRNSLGLSREKASELLETISPEKIERIENEKQLPSPEDVMISEETYFQAYKAGAR